MLKKKKNSKDTSPLQSYSVGKIKENKFGFIKIILCFTFFGAVIWFLPDLTIFYQQHIKGYFESLLSGSAPTVSNNTVSNNTTPNNNTVGNVENNVVEVENKYYFKDNKSVDVNNLTFSGAKYSQGELTFDVTNKLATSVNLEGTNVYFEVYDSSESLVKRFAILGVLNGNQSKKFTFHVNSPVEYYEVKEILEENYAYVLLEYDDDNISKLMCTRGNEKVLYTFFNEKLIKIDHVDEITKDDKDYDTKYTDYNSLYVKYRSNVGITSSFNVEDKILYYKMIINYNDSTIRPDYRLYFAKDTEPRIINFKVDSWEFDCK